MVLRAVGCRSPLAIHKTQQAPQLRCLARTLHAWTTLVKLWWVMGWRPAVETVHCCLARLSISKMVTAAQYRGRQTPHVQTTSSHGGRSQTDHARRLKGSKTGS